MMAEAELEFIYLASLWMLIYTRHRGSLRLNNFSGKKESKFVNSILQSSAVRMLETARESRVLEIGL